MVCHIWLTLFMNICQERILCRFISHRKSSYEQNRAHVGRICHRLEGVHSHSQIFQELGHCLAICGMLSQLNEEGPWWTVCHIVYRPWWQHMVATLVNKLWNSNTISQARLLWNLVFLPLLLCEIFWFIQYNVLWLNITDFDKAIKEPFLCLVIIEFLHPWPSKHFVIM